MKVIIQRVSKASVKADGYFAEIGRGLFILVGITHGDTVEVAEKLADKVFKMRLMKDAEGKMNNSVSEIKGEFLVVSQFTLYGDASSGNRPSFVEAAKGEVALPIYEAFCARLLGLRALVKMGSFGNYMQIEITLDGPVTIEIES